MQPATVREEDTKWKQVKSATKYGHWWGRGSGAPVMSSGVMFHTFAAATGNALPPVVTRRVARMSKCWPNNVQLTQLSQPLAFLCRGRQWVTPVELCGLFLLSELFTQVMKRSPTLRIRMFRTASIGQCVYWMLVSVQSDRVSGLARKPIYRTLTRPLALSTRRHVRP